MSVSTSPPRLLIVEDDADIRDSLRLLLEEEGYAASFAASVAEGLALLDQTAFHLVVTDLFAHQTGDPLTSVAPLRERAFPTPVGVMTGWHLSPEELERHGFTFIIAKPFDLETFLALIAAQLETRLTAEREPAVEVISRYFAALGARDWDGLAALCTEDVRYTLPGSSPFAAEVRGRVAFRAFAEETFAHFPDAHFEDVSVYPLPKGFIARYQGLWIAPDGSTQRQSGAVAFRFEGDRIARIGVRLNEAYLMERSGASRAESWPAVRLARG